MTNELVVYLACFALAYGLTLGALAYIGRGLFRALNDGRLPMWLAVFGIVLVGVAFVALVIIAVVYALLLI